MLDALFKGLLPLVITLATLWMLKDRKMKSTTVMLILIIVGVIGGGLGILGV